MKISKLFILATILTSANAAVIYFQDFASAGTVSSTTGATINGGVAGSATDGAYDIVYTITTSTASLFTINTANGVLNPNDNSDTVPGVAVRNDAEFDFTSELISTSFGDLLIEVDSANNTNDEVILQSVSVFDDGSQLFFDVAWASDKGDFQVDGNEALNVFYTLDGGSRVAFGDITDGTNLNDTPSSGVANVFLIPEPSSTALLGLGGIALLARRKR